jgi:hypothetical protein
MIAPGAFFSPLFHSGCFPFLDVLGCFCFCFGVGLFSLLLSFFALFFGGSVSSSHLISISFNTTFISSSDPIHININVLNL